MARDSPMFPSVYQLHLYLNCIFRSLSADLHFVAMALFDAIMKSGLRAEHGHRIEVVLDFLKREGFNRLDDLRGHVLQHIVVCALWWCATVVF